MAGKVLKISGATFFNNPTIIPPIFSCQSKWRAEDRTRSKNDEM